VSTLVLDAGTQTLLDSLRRHGVGEIELAFVLGSGLGSFAERIENACRIPYDELDGMPRSKVVGHAGQLVIGQLAGKRVLAQQGRVHLYEGWSVSEVTRAVRAFAALGCPRLIVTNAAGGLRREWAPGTLMAIRDHLNLQGRTPLSRAQSGYSAPYDFALRRALLRGAQEAGFTLEEGVYAGLLGPTYETPAEIAMLRQLGADAVGMSTVAEVLAASAAGVRVGGVSLITNFAAGITGEKLSHEEVIAAGKEAAGRFSELLERAAALA